MKDIEQVRIVVTPGGDRQAMTGREALSLALEYAGLAARLMEDVDTEYTDILARKLTDICNDGADI